MRATERVGFDCTLTSRLRVPATFSPFKPPIILVMFANFALLLTHQPSIREKAKNSHCMPEAFSGNQTVFSPRILQEKKKITTMQTLLLTLLWTFKEDGEMVKRYY